MKQLDLFPNDKLEFVLAMPASQLILMKGTDPNMYYTLREIRQEARKIQSELDYHQHKIATAKANLQRLIN